jgi:hypothetical protein
VIGRTASTGSPRATGEIGRIDHSARPRADPPLYWPQVKRTLGLGAALAAAALVPSVAQAAEGDVLVEFHFQPVADAQIAIWLVDAEGAFVKDVLVTQATGTLGIGNRPGRKDFLSSWRFPYGPRTGVLPVWGHARGKSYPALVFHDDNPDDQNSLGWHENSSSPEPFFCRPLSESENDSWRYDMMTCPSPGSFQSDKGRFGGDTSIYPPRSDHTEFEPGHDHEDVHMFPAINDLDSVTRATPPGDAPALFTTVLSAEEAARGPLTAWIEVNIEHDENPDWEFDREDDHYVDTRLSSYGIEWLGQPSIVYKVEFDPLQVGVSATDQYAGYGDQWGDNGDVNAPDATISTANGSGADRLQLFTKNDETFRFGVYSHGENGNHDPEDPWGECTARELPAMTGVELEPVEFDRVRVHFTVPELDGMTDIMRVRVYYRASEMALTDETLGMAIQQEPALEDCGDEIRPGVSTWCEVDELFGATNYQIGIVYEDSCSNASNVVAGSVTTPRQEFSVVEGFCFVATAAYGAPWEGKVQAMRWFRSTVLQSNGVGAALVAFYYHASPGMAAMIAESPVSRALARIALLPAAELAEAVTGTPWLAAGRAPTRRPD